jgi:hypothetical protein
MSAAASIHYGVIAELRSADALLDGVRKARAAGYDCVQAYAPYAVPGLAEAVGVRESHVPAWTFAGGVAGGAGGYFMQWFAATLDYPINVGGRPLHSWPSFVPVTFELAILCAALTAVAVMLAANGLPKLRHPVFGVEDFAQATRHRFFLCLPATPHSPDMDAARRFLESLEPMTVQEVRA